MPNIPKFTLSYNDAKEKYATAGQQMKSAVQSAIDKYQGRKG